MTNLSAHKTMGRAAPDRTNLVLEIYISAHCPNCAYAVEIAQTISAQFPHVDLRIIDIHQTTEQIPERVFATPTYLLNGQVWSLGNPSPAQLRETFAALLP